MTAATTDERPSRTVRQQPSPRVHGQRGGMWWANPLSPVLIVIIPMMLLSFWVPPRVYFEQWQEPKFFEFDAMFRVLVGALALCIGALIATRGRLGIAARDEWPALSPVARQVLRRAFFWCYRLAILAYGMWLLVAIRNGLRLSMLVDTLRAQDNFSGTLKAQFGTVTGVTTLTQLGIAASILGALLTSTPDKEVSRRVVVLVALAVGRGFFLAERLAIIEVVLPWLIVRSGRLAATRSRPTGRALVRFGPILAIPLLLLGFALFEYSRSWSFAKTRTDDTFVVYSTYRLAGYYATSFNNGELIRATTDRTNRLPFYTVEFVWEAPGLSSVIDYGEITGEPPRSNILAVASNPEFNSPGGMSAPFTDFGNVGAMLYFAAAGVVLGWLYRLFAASRLLGMLLYPLCFVGILELPRYLYWAQGRSTPAFVVLIAVAALVSLRARQVRTATTHGLL